MIVRSLREAEGTARTIEADDWKSVRLLLKDDGMGFSFHITTIYAGADFFMHYKHHLESVYCISGRGEIEDLSNGTVHPIAPGTVYALDQHDRHMLRAFEEMQMACVFNPPLHGKEVHGTDGAYALEAESVSADQ